MQSYSVDQSEPVRCGALTPGTISDSAQEAHCSLGIEYTMGDVAAHMERDFEAAERHFRIAAEVRRCRLTSG